MSIYRKTDISDVGLVILNYMTPEETSEMMVSIKKYYPSLKIAVVDNGSTKVVKHKLQHIVKGLFNVSLISLQENLGFARGNNAGIQKLKEEGYSYIVCSNNDVLFNQKGILESLKYHCVKSDAAVVGPRIKNLNNQDQNPYRLHRHTLKEAKSYYRRACWIPDTGFPALKVWRYAKNYLNFNTVPPYHKATPEQPCHVYTLHGSFIMFGPLFFKYYEGFDGNTFLYCEENILGEMLLAKSLKAVFVPECVVIHKEDKTTDYVWGSNTNKMIFKHKKKSIKYWFKKWYLKQNSIEL